MPEYPDITIYVESLADRVVGATLDGISFHTPFVLRSVEPAPDDLNRLTVRGVERLGKRILIALANDFWIVIHLMVAGRLAWKPVGAKPGGRKGLAVFHFSSGELTLTEAGTRRRASVFLVSGTDGLGEHDPGGIDVFESSFAEFRERFIARNHTLKRALTDPHILSGIGNAYSDEILHRAGLSPVKLTHRLTEPELESLFESIHAVLTEWAEKLRGELQGGWPKKVTAFRPEMAVHGRYGKPCPVCGTTVQRIRYKSNETNYCPRCQTGGRILADRSLSRLLKSDWPKTIEELEG